MKNKQHHDAQKRWKKDNGEEISYRKKQKSQDSFLNSDADGDSFGLEDNFHKHVPKKRSESYNNQRRIDDFGDDGGKNESQDIQYEYI